MTFYQTSQWRYLARATKRRDSFRCQICADRPGNPYCVLHAHHITPRAQFGSDDLENLPTLCDLCHAVVTPRWHKPWFPDGMRGNPAEIVSMRAEYEEFLRLPPAARRERQSLLWAALGVS